MWLFGTYFYHGVARWWLGPVPVYIPLLWAVIVHSSMAFSDRAGLPLWSRPVMDGLLAVLIDLAIDAIAIRVGLWSWSIPLDEGWFGVPAGNLCAWMFVAGWYGGVMRLVRRRAAQNSEPSWHRWLVPPFAYAGLFGSLFAIGTLGQWLGLKTPDQRLWLFAGQSALCLGLVALASARSAAAPAVRIAPSLVWSRWAMHGSFAMVLIAGGIWRRIPVLLGVSAATVGLEWAVQRWCERRARHVIQ